jgi:hypothetical protein
MLTLRPAARQANSALLKAAKAGVQLTTVTSEETILPRLKVASL